MAKNVGDSVKLNIGTRAPRRSGSALKGGLIGLRREIDGRVIEMIMRTLTPHQRELLRATAGNPMLEIHLEHFVQSLLNADAVLGASRKLLTTHEDGNSVGLGEEK